jgi:predicted RNase H-like HicB family nuclease
MKKNILLQNVVWKEDKYFVAQCLNVDVSSFGDTKKQALLNLEEALELYFEDVSLTKLNKIEQPEIVKQSLRYA